VALHPLQKMPGNKSAISGFCRTRIPPQKNGDPTFANAKV
jgi:hypothetical protein